jgi:hypothetical protein
MYVPFSVFCVLFVCKCVLLHCHCVSTQLQLNIYINIKNNYLYYYITLCSSILLCNLCLCCKILISLTVLCLIYIHLYISISIYTYIYISIYIYTYIYIVMLCLTCPESHVWLVGLKIKIILNVSIKGGFPLPHFTWRHRQI